VTTDRALGFGSLDPDTDEVSTTLPVEGDLPAWLSGTLIRNGPGTFAIGDGREVGHWFDGLAMVHAFSFGSDGDREGDERRGADDSDEDEIRYASRFLETDAYRAARAGDFGGGFATGETTLRDRLKAFIFGDAYDNTNIIAERVGRKYLALTESPRWVEFDPRSLETVGDVQYDGPEPSGQLACAHMQRDPWTDRLVNFEIEFGRTSSYHVYEMRRPNRRRHVVSIPVSEPAYMHSFALTDGFVVLTEFPLVVDPSRALRPGTQGPFIENFEWVPERGTRFYVIDRDLGEVVATPRTDPLFGFHHVNAYEAGVDDGSPGESAEGGTNGDDGTNGENGTTVEAEANATDGYGPHELVIDLETVPDAESLGASSLSNLREGDLNIPGGAIERFRVRIDGRANASVDREEIHPGATGLPTASPARWCREYRYAYAQGGDQPMTDWLRAVVKLDVETGEVVEFTDGGNYLSEPIFVPRPDPGESNESNGSKESNELNGLGRVGRSDDRMGGADNDFRGRFPVRSGGRDHPEDNGVVLAVSLDTDAERSSLLCLDAETMTERARAPVPHAIPFGFHGRYFPEFG
jgi:beta-carotene 15,15'-monooxygenase